MSITALSARAGHASGPVRLGAQKGEPDGSPFLRNRLDGPARASRPRALRRALTLIALVVALVTAVLAQALLAVAAGAQPAAHAPVIRQPSKPLDVPYVETPDRVVKAMLELARVKKDDVLIDLGCGDGRIPIAAAKRFGTRGLGIDLDPERITEARANAHSAGVVKLVRFIEGDIFDADIRAATVVMLYLLPEVNLRLRPKLLTELKPGTRVVSHNYDMGDWEPDKTVRLAMPGGAHLIHLWTIPPPGRVANEDASPQAGTRAPARR